MSLFLLLSAGHLRHSGNVIAFSIREQSPSTRIGANADMAIPAPRQSLYTVSVADIAPPMVLQERGNMQIACAHCHEILEFTEKRPSFCANCGKPITELIDQSTADPDPDAPTQAREPPAAEVDARDPTEVGRFRLLRLLGEGGMGRVYEAEDTATGRRVALKLIARTYTSAADAVERFRREGRLASALSHPRCVFVLAADEEAGRPYIVMELMPGDTLADLLRRRGPLPVEEALRKILDVIEGLQEAHRLGMVHRDVKPSNCFLEPDGRVKVGDFGLAKSLVSGAALTRTGSFIGTPLFASPEQIKGEATGPASDVYSVAATLYCLLTGKAPFQGSDAAATVARIVSDAAPSMRSLHPEVPEALDRVVLRGLERDPERRWRDLGQFRAALLPFMPGQLSLVGLGVRFGAYWIDHFILGLAITPLGVLTAFQTPVRDPLGGFGVETGTHLISLLGYLVYFGVPESLWGRSFAKFALGFRVVKAASAERPELWRSMLRTGAYWAALHLFVLGAWALKLLALIIRPHVPAEAVTAGIGLATCCSLPLSVVGPVLLLCTMRSRNGYRGLHEWLSGTRVVPLPEAEARRTLGSRCRELTIERPAGIPPQLGPFAVLATLRDDGADAVLVGEDAVLGRRALLWLRPADTLGLTPEQRAIARPTRLRWLAGGQQGDQQWDAYLFPAGHSLREVVATEGRLSWAETRHMLMQLTDELRAAQSDGTLPWSLAIEQVWIQSDGRLQLLDVPMAGAEANVGALPLLAQVAVLALEGKLRDAAGARARIRAPLPEHASRLLDRLVGPGRPYRKLQTLQEDLAATAANPAAVHRRRRFAHLALLWFLLYSGLGGSLLLMAVCPGPALAFNELMQLQNDERSLHRMEALVARDVAGALNAEPVGRGLALQQLNDDLELRGLVLARVQRQRSEHDSRLRSVGWAARQVLLLFDKVRDAQLEALGSRFFLDNPQLTRNIARRGAAHVDQEEQIGILVFVLFAMTMFIGLVAVYVLWAFVWRGGLSFRILGLSLVRRDGRPALRLQCVWRAILFWTPVAALLVASVCLDCWYWLTWQPDASRVYVAWLSSVAWWAGLGLFPLYALLALRSPERSLHDRLAGTYLVPQ
jgi:hypothetical protein